MFTNLLLFQFAMAGNGPDSLPPSTMPTAQAQGMAVSTPNMTTTLNGMNGAAPDPAVLDGLPKVCLLVCESKFFCALSENV